MEFRGLGEDAYVLAITMAKISAHVESVHSISASGSGVSAHSIGCPSNPLKGRDPSSSAAVSRCIVPSASPNAMYAPVGDTAAEVR